jgi:hypothetical protein
LYSTGQNRVVTGFSNDQMRRTAFRTDNVESLVRIEALVCDLAFVLGPTRRDCAVFRVTGQVAVKGPEQKVWS